MSISWPNWFFFSYKSKHMLLFHSALNCLGPSSRAKSKACIWQNPTWSGSLPFSALLSSPFPLSHWLPRCFWHTVGTLMSNDFWTIFPIILRMLPTPNCHLSHLHTSSILFSNVTFSDYPNILTPYTNLCPFNNLFSLLCFMFFFIALTST